MGVGAGKAGHTSDHETFLTIQVIRRRKHGGSRRFDSHDMWDARNSTSSQPPTSPWLHTSVGWDRKPTVRPVSICFELASFACMHACFWVQSKTKWPPVCIFMDRLPDESAAALATIQNGDPPREALIALHATVEELNSSSHRKGAFKQLHEIVSVRGCVVNVAVWEEPHWEFVKQNCKVGDFLRIRNVNKGSLDSGLICKFKVSLF